MTDAGLAHLVAHRQLKSLRLVGTKVTNAGMKHVARLRNLEELYLGDGSAVTDAGLPPLATLPRLKKIYIVNFDAGTNYLKLTEARPLILFDTVPDGDTDRPE